VHKRRPANTPACAKQVRVSLEEDDMTPLGAAAAEIDRARSKGTGDGGRECVHTAPHPPGDPQSLAAIAAASERTEPQPNPWMSLNPPPYPVQNWVEFDVSITVFRAIIHY